MTTVRLGNSVFMHIPKAGGTSATRAFGVAGMIKYDYRFDHESPIQHGYQYDKECRLQKNGRGMPHPTNSLPHAKINDLRSEDRDLRKFVIVRDPFAWYRSYWSHHSKFQWTTEVNPPYLQDGGRTNFGTWMESMVSDSVKKGRGYYTQYIQDWVDDKTDMVRLGHLKDDLKTVLESLGEPTECLKHLGHDNANSESNDLIIPLCLVDKIKELDLGIFELH